MIVVIAYAALHAAAGALLLAVWRRPYVRRLRFIALLGAVLNLSLLILRLMQIIARL